MPKTQPGELYAHKFRTFLRRRNEWIEVMLSRLEFENDNSIRIERARRLDDKSFVQLFAGVDAINIRVASPGDAELVREYACDISRYMPLILDAMSGGPALEAAILSVRRQKPSLDLEAELGF